MYSGGRETGPAIGPVDGHQHWLGSGAERIFMWEKRAQTPLPRGLVLLVHGSSACARPTFDLQVPARPDASLMNWLACSGFDVWCFDCRGYGRSYKGLEVAATCSDGADDAAAVSQYIMDLRRLDRLFVYGTSSGALRASIFASRFPDRVGRLAVDGMVWTGRGSRTLEERRQKLAQWKASTRRPVDPAFIRSIVTRDLVPSADPQLVDCFAEQALENDDVVPTGTYIDMCENLPVVDPQAILAPTLILRGEFDGVGTLEDDLAFFAALKTASKQIHVMAGMAHATNLQKNFFTSYQRVEQFFSQSETAPLERA